VLRLMDVTAGGAEGPDELVGEPHASAETRRQIAVTDKDGERRCFTATRKERKRVVPVAPRAFRAWSLRAVSHADLNVFTRNRDSIDTVLTDRAVVLRAARLEVVEKIVGDNALIVETLQSVAARDATDFTSLHQAVFWTIRVRFANAARRAMPVSTVRRGRRRTIFRAVVVILTRVAVRVTADGFVTRTTVGPAVAWSLRAATDPVSANRIRAVSKAIAELTTTVTPI
jgi:hypothetical protein